MDTTLAASRIYNTTGDYAKITGSKDTKIRMESCNFNSLAFDRCKSIALFSSAVKDFNINPTKLDTVDLQFTSSAINNLTLYNCVIKNFEIYQIGLPENIFLNKIAVHNSLDVVDLNPFIPHIGKTCGLVVYRSDISKFKFNYVNFDLNLQENHTGTLETYNKIIEIQKKYGYDDGLRKADIELRQFQYSQEGAWGSVKNWLDGNWWYYGYEKQNTILNSFAIYGLFFLINLGLYKKLLHRTYTVEQLSEIDKDQNHQRSTSKINEPVYKTYIRNAVYCLIYTGFIFWGLKFSYEKLKLKNLGLSLLLIFEYTSGIVCLAYIANYILSR